MCNLHIFCVQQSQRLEFLYFAFLGITFHKNFLNSFITTINFVIFFDYNISKLIQNILISCFLIHFELHYPKFPCSYNNIGLQVSLAKPHLRAEFENDLKLICEGRKDPEVVRREQIEKYKEVFRTVIEKMRGGYGKMGLFFLLKF